MSKLTRTVLKEIVKECIVEIFEESFFNPNASLVNENKTIRKNRRSNDSTQRSKRPTKPAQQSKQQKSYLDNVSYGREERSNQTVNEQFDNKINHLTSKMTKDPIMSEIFKDTAAKTLQNQNSADSKRGASVLVNGDAAAKLANQSDPAELFAESASKWATLAFADSIKK